MSTLTSQLHHCFVCLRRTSLLNTNSSDPVHDVTQNAEICKRFATLVSRYLNLLVSDGVAPEITLSHCRNFSSTDKYLCDGCVPVAESFCQMYDVWFCLRLEMDRCLDKMGQLIEPLKEADKDSQPRQFSNDKNQAQMSDTTETEEKLNFRDAFLKHVAWSRGKSFPRLRLKKENCIPTLSSDRANQVSNVQSVSEAFSDFKLEVRDESYPDDTNDDIDFPSEDVDGGPLKLESDAIQSLGSGSDDNPFADTEALVNKSRIRSKGTSQTHHCTQCSKQFAYRTSLKNHIRWNHENLRPFGCVFCQQSYRRRNLLERHIQNHTLEKANHCKICLEEFCTPESLSSHKRVIHFGKRPQLNKCRFCSKQFASRYSRLKHEKKLHEKEFAASKLSIFSIRQPLVYKCMFCSTISTTRPNFKCHLRTHTGYKPFKCELCDKRFVRKSYLQEHLFVHEDPTAKPFKCSLCSRGFVQKSRLTYHMKKRHAS